ncbi:hypothetical protein Gotur_034402 [Gossypium turneri]
MVRDEISLLADKLVHLNVKSSLVVPTGKSMLLCSKDLMHAIGSTFGGVLQSEIKGDDCQLKVQLDIQKPLRRGIFISARN